MTASSASRSSVSETRPPLEPGAPQLWLCRLDSVAGERIREQYRALLSPSELDQCARYRRPWQRRRAVLTRVLVRTALSHYSLLECDYRLALCVRCEGATPAPDLHIVITRPLVDIESSPLPLRYCGISPPRSDCPR